MCQIYYDDDYNMVLAQISGKRAQFQRSALSGCPEIFMRKSAKTITGPAMYKTTSLCFFSGYNVLRNKTTRAQRDSD